MILDEASAPSSWDHVRKLIQGDPSTIAYLPSKHAVFRTYESLFSEFGIRKGPGGPVHPLLTLLNTQGHAWLFELPASQCRSHGESFAKARPTCRWRSQPWFSFQRLCKDQGSQHTQHSQLPRHEKHEKLGKTMFRMRDFIVLHDFSRSKSNCD